ncbi:MAG: YraN family protein [bacterium]
MNDLGREGEDNAAACLKTLGFKVVERGWYCPTGEIDIIAVEGKILVFVEVKTRSTGAFGGAFAAVTRTKQKKITKTALSYIKAKKLKPQSVRFDVVAIEEGRPPELLRNAFIPPRYTF